MKKERENNRNLFFRPVGLEVLARLYVYFAERNRLATLQYALEEFRFQNSGGVFDGISGSGEFCSIFDQPPETLDSNDTQIIFTQGPFNTGNYDGAPYNGFVFTNLNMGSPITGFLLSSNGFTGLTNSKVSFTANSLNVNLSGVFFANTAGFTVNLLTSAVPEPSTANFFFAALAGVGGAFYWRRKQARSPYPLTASNPDSSPRIPVEPV